MDLQGRHALITGGGRGIGLAIAAALLQQGARVTLLGRHAPALQQALNALRTQGHREQQEETRQGQASQGQAQQFQVAHVTADVSDPEAVRQACAAAAARFGRIDILVNLSLIHI